MYEGERLRDGMQRPAEARAKTSRPSHIQSDLLPRRSGEGLEVAVSIQKKPFVALSSLTPGAPRTVVVVGAVVPWVIDVKS